MYTLLILSIVAAFVLFFITKTVFKAENESKEKQKLLKKVNLIGLIILLFLFVYNLRWRIIRVIGGSPLFYLPVEIPAVITYLFAVISVVLYIKSIRLSVNGKLKEKVKKDENSLFGKYYTSFKILFIIYWLLSTASTFLIVGFIEEWDLDFFMVIRRLIACTLGAIVYTYLYFLPYFIAVKKQHRQTRAIYILSIFTSWTLIAWVIALVWANMESKDVVVASRIQPSAEISVGDEILSYKKLLDDGLITKEEFDKKKKQILDL